MPPYVILYSNSSICFFNLTIVFVKILKQKTKKFDLNGVTSVQFIVFISNILKLTKTFLMKIEKRFGAVHKLRNAILAKI